MSATGRGKERNKRDLYETDPRLTRALLRASDAGQCPLIPASGLWVEPCYGRGKIVQAVNSLWPCAREDTGAGFDREWYTCDIDPESGADEIADFRDPKVGVGADVLITNPPFSIQREIIESALAKRPPHGLVIMLVNNHFFGPAKMLDFHRAHPCDRVALSPRPSFGLNKHGKAGTDQCTYEWIVWGWPGATSYGKRWFGPIDWRKA